MIAFGSAITRPDVYRAAPQPGIRRAAEPDSVDPRRCRRRLDLRELQRAARPGRRARRPRGARARAPGRGDRRRRLLRHGAGALADPDVGVVGCVGAVGVRSIAWWEGSVTLASFIHRYDEHGGGDLPAFSWAWDEAPPYARTGEVDTLDGFVLVLVAVGGAQRALRRVARRAPRLRPRLLPPGPRGRPQGRHRRLPRDPPPCARAVQRPGGVDRGAHARRREVGRPDARRSAGARDLARAGAARRGRARRRARSSTTRTRCRPRPASRELERAIAETHGQHLVADHGAAAARRRRGDPASAGRDRLRLAEPRPTALRGAGHRARRGARLRRARLRGRRPDRAQPTTCCSTTPRGYEDLEALVLVHAHAEIADPRFCAKVRATLGDPDVAVAGCAGAPASRASRGGRARSAAARSSTATRSTAAASCRRFAWAAPRRRAGRGRRGRRLPARAVAVGGAQPALRRGARTARLRRRLLPAGARRRPQGRRPPTCGSSTTARSSWSSDIDLWVEAHMQLAEKWDAELTGEPRTRRLEGARAAGRGRARGRARASRYSHAARWRRARRSSSSARCERDDRRPSAGG